MGRTRVNFRLPKDLIQKADVAAEVSKKNRTDIVKAALRAYPDEIEDDETFKEAVVERSLGDQIGFDVLKAFIGRQDAESVRASRNPSSTRATTAAEPLPKQSSTTATG